MATTNARRQLPERLLKCRGGPLDGARLTVPPWATEISVPLPGATPGALPLVAVYRVQRRRHARGAAFVVLAYVRNVPRVDSPR